MKSSQFLGEGFVEDANDVHADHEVQMARADCFHAAEDALALHKLLRHIDEHQGIEGWVAAKVTLAADYLKTVREHLEYQMMSGQPVQAAGELSIAESKQGITKDFNIVKWYNTQDDKFDAQAKLAKWLKKEAGLPTNSLVLYFDEPALVYNDETIMPRALSNPKLNLSDLLNAVKKAASSEQGVAEAAKWRDPKYKDRLYTQEPSDSDEYDDIGYGYDFPERPENDPGQKRRMGGVGSEFDHNDPLKKGQGIGRTGIKHNLNTAGKRKGLPSRDQITSLKGSIKDAHGKHHKANLPEQGVAEDAVSDFIARGGKVQHGKTHPPRKAEKWQGSAHIGAAGGKGTKGQVSGLGANTRKTGKPVVSTEGADFGSNYAEQLAQQVFDHNSDIKDENQVLNLGYNIAKSDLGSRAQGIFRDEDFPSDFVSAYFYLQKQNVAEGAAKGEYGRVLDALQLYYPRLSMEELNVPGYHKVIANKANVPVEYAAQVINDFVGANDSDDEWADDNYQGDELNEMSAGSVATVVNPTPKNKAKVGTLFGGTYKQKSTKGK